MTEKQRDGSLLLFASRLSNNNDEWESIKSTSILCCAHIQTFYMGLNVHMANNRLTKEHYYYYVFIHNLI